MSKYHFNDIEDKWQKYWAKNQTFKAENKSEKPKYYVLDMFPYPSGAGLHVGHPLGYIASDIYTRYKRHQGFNVLHPQGYDSFGLPAEQYAIQTGQHPAKTTEENIARYREQLDKLGFSFDWSREVRTSNPEYYKWTQWIFLQLFDSWYDKDQNKALAIEELRVVFSSEGNIHVNAVCDEGIELFTASEWLDFSETKKQEILLKYRLTYLAETEVNWCPQLGTVLANDEIVNGVSERGGYPVVRKKMKQWSMRITAYAQRLLDGLDKIDWPQPLKDSQTNWIGRSKGSSVTFNVKDHDAKIDVFTTRPDTIFGVSFMTLAPEHDLVSKITTAEQKEAVENYIEATAKRSERERMADVKTITGVFTGAYAEHPFTGDSIPVWIGDYVLAGYGTGAVMSVPCGDQRDYDFAKHFNLPIPNIFKDADISKEAYSDKDNTIITNSDFLNDLNYKQATEKIIAALEEKGVGEGKINYRLRDAVFSRQRYWGEPFPIYYKDGMPHPIPTECLPLRLPEVEKYLPTEEGEPPLGRAENWSWDEKNKKIVSNENVSPSAVEGSSNENGIYPLELNTMPGWAGSSWYFFRYMEDEKRDEVFASKEALNYWKNVDLYIGGSEHATGHLLYSRFWVKFMHDRGLVPVEEPFKKLINQGMILGESAFVYAISFFQSKKIEDNDKELNKYLEFLNELPDLFLSRNKIKEGMKLDSMDLVSVSDYPYKDLYNFLKNEINDRDIDANEFDFNVMPIHADVSLVNTSNVLDVEGFKSWREDFKNAKFILEEDGSYKVGREVEKMSKSKYNVVNPDDICNQYGADTLRMYEMFLGPLEQAKPWNTAGITGVHGFLKKLWKLYHSPFEGCKGDVSQSQEPNDFYVSDEAASKDSLKTLHKTIKKTQEDIEHFSFNTSVSSFMIAVNELTSQNCNSREVLEPLAILISPYAPHIAEELWQKLGHSESISIAPFPKFDQQYLVESSKEYPISFNGKMRFTLELPLDLNKEEIESAVMAHEKTAQYLEGRTPKKVIIVPGKIVNIVG
ncbi:leucine--tRNA ligase [Aequorivita antarctica]|uniref:Leucine--tRNA ligase n=1 Tax=Aequorivita antarctica TaxID=153266 RepID=A0A5C6Z2T1_9FLAO|nr:class I tRNA ligase family protein [Aequorivita antarctica]TXD73965.1 leucine--tRNA ligase [Aequorivita antarctica]SRX73315.1 Leucine--tRNA ligase [Aequorivita antarctica]